MPNPNRVQILDHIEDSLEAIATPAYFTTAAAVERYVYAVNEIPSFGGADGTTNLTPWFGFCIDGVEEVISENPSNMMLMRLPITVVGHAATRDTDEQTEVWRDTMAAWLIDDIKHALCGTETLSRRGGQAIETQIVDTDSDLGIPVRDALENGANTVTVIVHAFCRYEQPRSHNNT